ncbi:hypothetical protein ACXZ65_37085 [Streptomyces aculeolatus]
MHCCAPATSANPASGAVLLPAPAVAPPAAGPYRPAADRRTRGQLVLSGRSLVLFAATVPDLVAP